MGLIMRKWIFVSVGGAANTEQEIFVEAVRERLRDAGFEPQTVGDGFWDNSSPLNGAKRLFERCDGAVIIANERYFFESGVQNRGEGGREAKELINVALPTAWNQIEGAMAFTNGIPLFVLVHKSLHREGIFELSPEWQPIYVEGLSKDLHTPQFSGLFESWCKQVRSFSRTEPKSTHASAEADLLKDVSLVEFIRTKGTDLERMSLGQTLGLMRPGQIWAAITTLSATVVGIATIAYTVGVNAP